MFHPYLNYIVNVFLNLHLFNDFRHFDIFLEFGIEFITIESEHWLEFLSTGSGYLLSTGSNFLSLGSYLPLPFFAHVFFAFLSSVCFSVPEIGKSSVFMDNLLNFSHTSPCFFRMCLFKMAEVLYILLHSLHFSFKSSSLFGVGNLLCANMVCCFNARSFLNDEVHCWHLYGSVKIFWLFLTLLVNFSNLSTYFHDNLHPVDVHAALNRLFFRRFYSTLHMHTFYAHFCSVKSMLRCGCISFDNTNRFLSQRYKRSNFSASPCILFHSVQYSFWHFQTGSHDTSNNRHSFVPWHLWSFSYKEYIG